MSRTPGSGEAAAPVPPARGGRIVDLTIPIADGMAAFPGEPTARFRPFSAIDDADGIEMWHAELFSQLGTHVDAPRHFIAGGASVDEIDLASCIGPATIVDVAATDRILPAHLEPHEAAIRETQRVVLRTGWSRKAGTEAYWTGFAELSPAAATRLVQLGVRFLGLDTPTPSLTDLHEVHELLLGAGVVVAECLVNVGGLASPTYLICLPLPLVGLDGSPARIVAVEGSAGGVVS